MVIDIHTHICALGRGGTTSDKIVNSLAFRFMRWRLGIRGARETWQKQLEQVVARTIETSGLDAAVVLAFDAVYGRDGERMDEATHMYVENDYVAALARENPRILFGASVHPYRRDAVAELERCVAMGAVLVKWLPLTQQMDPADERCIPLYEAMAHHRIPLLCHSGGEKTLAAPDQTVKNPAKLKLALDHGVTVIAAHCGTRSIWGEEEYLETFCRMAREHERFYGDTAAITLPTRSYCIPRILADDGVRKKLLHGSDWPVISLPTLRYLGLLREANWMKRDILIKRALGFDDACFQRAESILKMPRKEVVT